MTQAALPVHPFPARMAPAFALSQLPSGGRRRHVLDPMMGSGTIPVLASLNGHLATGFDLDPLALIIAKAWGKPLDSDRFSESLASISEDARQQEDVEPIFSDSATDEFISRWFDPVAKRRLGALARCIDGHDDDLRPALWCAFSRLIITKEAGASLARDVSHSRPHKVRDTTDFDPIEHFIRSGREVQRRHEALSPVRPDSRTLDLRAADARRLPLDDATIDIVMTSPPYLIAIDYLRGHRMSLVWMGHSVNDLRELRGTTIGSQRGLRTPSSYDDLIGEALGEEAPSRAQAVLRRWVVDLDAVLRETVRVLKTSGKATFVVADATLFGIPVRLSHVLDQVAHAAGLLRTERIIRELPSDRRYLPPPGPNETSQLSKRMREEVCLMYSLA